MPQRSARKRAYHHCDLARGLVEAAEGLLAERGIKGFTLRECARRAGVSHAAPKHHFGDATGLLTEVAAVGFDRLAAATRAAAEEETDPVRRARASGAAYVRFALTYPALFRLMFQSDRLDRTDERLIESASAAFAVPAQLAAGLRRGPAPASGPKPEAAAIRLWALVHGFAMLAIDGRLGPLDQGGVERLVRAAQAVMEVEWSAERPA